MGGWGNVQLPRYNRIMRVVQFEIPESGRRVGIVHDDEVLDITSRHPTLQRSVDLFDLAQAKGVGLEPCLRELAGDATLARHPYFDMLAACPGERRPFLHPAVDHPDGYRVHIAGTGLTHLGSMQSRDSMHAEPASDDATKSDSRRMFEMGLREGRPAAPGILPGQRVVRPCDRETQLSLPGAEQAPAVRRRTRIGHRLQLRGDHAALSGAARWRRDLRERPTTQRPASYVPFAGQLRGPSLQVPPNTGARATCTCTSSAPAS